MNRIIFILVLLCMVLVTAPAAKSKDQCIACHSKKDFFISQPHLFQYFGQWKHSPHNQVGVSCKECHGGDASQTNLTLAHKEMHSLQGREATKKVLSTCGSCHKSIAEGYQKSRHYLLAQGGKQKHLTPNCVTCHGSMSSGTLAVSQLPEICGQCHASDLEAKAALDQRVEILLNQFSAIHRFYRYVSLKGDPKETRAFLIEIDQKLHQLSSRWHTLNLKMIEEETEGLLTKLQAKHKELRSSH